MSDIRNYRPDVPPIVKNLLIINVLVFVAQLLYSNSDSNFNLTQWLQLYPVMPEELRMILQRDGHPLYSSGQQFYPYQIATHMFAHSPGTFFHILFNMLGLWMFGSELENRWGPKRFLLFYLVCGVGAAALHLLIHYFRCLDLLAAVQADDPNLGRLVGAASPALGASGALMGILAAYAYHFPDRQLYIMALLPVKAKWAVLGMAAYDVFGGVSNTGDNIAHFAHLGGALTGFILVLIWNKTGRKRFY